jgi:hypothetical protein
MFDVHPLTLTGHVVRLAPLAETHVPDLAAAGRDESIWRFMRYGTIYTEAQMLAFVRHLLDL